ncbi:MAG: hypothetical protein M0Z77_01730 [Thermoplasmatales archaeon]|jgi:NADH:ubiquinone oxidoreductase subunit 6 (subunit J)|nr:hypothetical protein [Thermoplasmatales archaeon]
MEVFSALNIYGSVALVIMMIFYMVENRSPVYTLLFGLMCIATSAYGFLSGTWPFGVIELAWFAVSIRRYMKIRRNKEMPVNF